MKAAGTEPLFSAPCDHAPNSGKELAGAKFLGGAVVSWLVSTPDSVMRTLLKYFLQKEIDKAEARDKRISSGREG